jgi:hypothetical protein
MATHLRRPARQPGWHQTAATPALPGTSSEPVNHAAHALRPEAAGHNCPAPRPRSGAAINAHRIVLAVRPGQHAGRHHIRAPIFGGNADRHPHPGEPANAHGPRHPSERHAGSKTSDTYPPHPGRQRLGHMQSPRRAPLSLSSVTLGDDCAGERDPVHQRLSRGHPSSRPAQRAALPGLSPGLTPRLRAAIVPALGAPATGSPRPRSAPRIGHRRSRNRY